MGGEGPECAHMIIMILQFWLGFRFMLSLRPRLCRSPTRRLMSRLGASDRGQCGSKSHLVGRLGAGSLGGGFRSRQDRDGQGDEF